MDKSIEKKLTREIEKLELRHETLTTQKAIIDDKLQANEKRLKTLKEYQEKYELLTNSISDLFIQQQQNNNS